MSYPLINGAVINGSGGGDIVLLPSGLDLLAADPHTAVGSTVAGDAQPLELGDANVQFAIEPSGLDILDHGVALAFYDPVLSPPGLDILQHGAPAMAVNPVAGDAYVLEFGATELQIGSRIQARPLGMDLVTSGLHVASVGPVLPTPMTGMGVGARPMELGSPAVAPGPYAAVAGGAAPLELGAPWLGVAVIAGDGEPLELGVAMLGMAASAGGANPLELGAHNLGMSFTVTGMDLVVAGQHGAVGGGMSTVAGEAWPLELGSPGQPGFASVTRSQFPLLLGSASIHRGTSC